MSEELIYQKENDEATAESAAPAEPMGTVIAMESVKPVFTAPAPAETESKTDVESKTNAERNAGTESKANTEADSSVTAERNSEPVSASVSGTDSTAKGEPEEMSDRNAQTKEAHTVISDSNIQEKHRIRDFFHFKKNVEDFTREDWILSRIPEEDLMEYLALEHKKNEMLQHAKEIKEKRIFTTLQIAISLAAIVGVVGLLRDNPTVLVNILYITGIIIALWIWRGKQDK